MSKKQYKNIVVTLENGTEVAVPDVTAISSNGRYFTNGFTKHCRAMARGNDELFQQLLLEEMFERELSDEEYAIYEDLYQEDIIEALTILKKQGKDVKKA